MVKKILGDVQTSKGVIKMTKYLLQEELEKEWKEYNELKVGKPVGLTDFCTKVKKSNKLDRVIELLIEKDRYES